MRKSSEGRMHNNPTDDVEVRYSHIIKVITDWIDTTNLVVVGGRGLAKSTVIQARRLRNCKRPRSRTCQGCTSIFLR